MKPDLKTFELLSQQPDALGLSAESISFLADQGVEDISACWTVSGLCIPRTSQMNKRTAGYWAVTALLALVLGGSGLGALTRQPSLIEAMEHLGFPLYVMPILGTSYVAASVALLAPGLPVLKEWAYAGIVFAMTGAFASHVLSGDALGEMVPPVAIISLAVASYVLRPASRRLSAETADRDDASSNY